MRNVLIYPDGEGLAQAAAEFIAAAARRTCAARGGFTWMLAGGSTPRRVYALLSEPRLADGIDWRRVRVFWGDERCTPPDHAESNYHMAWDELLRHAPIPRANIHRIRGEIAPEAAAEEYDHLLRELLAGGPDLALLGIGEDGHTASLFPGSAALDEREKLAVAVAHSQPPPPLVARVTVTLPALNAARQVLFLVSGAGKAEMVRRALRPRAGEAEIPARLVAPTQGEVIWMVDEAAGGDVVTASAVEG
ncbi:MAG: 6-phosphogluconolactonase [Chloroflexi bacterium]|nr:6-phosphogluconolactonase [Chloroflexota bacterium]